MKFSVVVSVRGAICLEVEADSREDACEIAEEKTADMDFNRLEDIDWVVVDAWHAHAGKE